jgi:hypothetical protein
MKYTGGESTVMLASTVVVTVLMKAIKIAP